MEKSGCGLAVGIGLALVIAAGLWYGAGGGRQEDGTIRYPVATIGKETVFADEVEAEFDAQMSARETPAVSPSQELNTRAQALMSTIQRRLVKILADREKIEATPAVLRATFEKDLDEMIDSTRQQFIDEGKLKADSPPEEFDKLFKEATQQSVGDFRRAYTERIDRDLADPAQLTGYIDTHRLRKLRESYQSRQRLDDAQLEKAFRSYTLKRINFGLETPGQPKPEDQAKAAEAEIGGGLAFEKAIVKYTKDTGTTTEPVVERKFIQTGASLFVDDELSSLIDLKPGEVSKVLQTASGPVIYKLVSIEGGPPADFAQRKEHYREMYSSPIGDRALEKDVEALEKELVTWKSTAYHALYDYYKSTWNTEFLSKSPAEQVAALRDILERAKAAEGDPIGFRTSVLLQYAVVDRLWTQSSAEEKAEMRGERIESISRVLENIESFDLRLSLYGLFAAEKDPAAAEQLLLAAQSNTDFGELGKRQANMIKERLDALEKAGYVPAEKLAEIQELLDEWKKEMEADEAARAEMKAEEERMQREAEEEAKREREEAEKAQDPGR